MGNKPDKKLGNSENRAAGKAPFALKPGNPDVGADRRGDNAMHHEPNGSDKWVKGVRIVDKHPRGHKELAFLGKHKSRNFVVLAEVLYQAKGDKTIRSYWAKSVRDLDHEDRYINAQAKVVHHLQKFNIKGIWKAKHFLEIKRSGEQTNKMILCEKFPPGRTLFQLIYDDGKNGIPEDKALRIIMKLGKIVQELHNAGVFHWDLSTKNIWITDDEEVVLFDWDFAFTSTEEFLKRKLWRCGTPHYLSRERLIAMEKSYESSECFLRTDSFHAHEVYGLISILTHMLIGNEFLKYGNHFGIPHNEHQSLGHHLRQRNKKDDGISPWLREMLSKTLIAGKSPFRTVDEFILSIQSKKEGSALDPVFSNKMVS